MNHPTPGDGSSFGAQVRAALTEHGVSVRGLARRTHYDHAYLCRTLAGQQRPSNALANAIDTALGAEGTLATLAATLTPDDTARVAHSASQPSRVDGETVDALASVLAAQRHLEDAIGPRAVLSGAAAQFATVADLVRDARGPHRRALVDVAAQWSTFMGWLYTTCGQHAHAATRFNGAADWAAEADNPSLGSYILAFKAYAAGKRGDAAGKEGLTAAARRTPGIHPAQQVFNLFQHARAFADLDERDTTARLLDEATGLIDMAEREGEPPVWAYWYNRAFFEMNIGLTYAYLGWNDVASDMITAGIGELPAEQRGADWVKEFTVATNGR